MGQRVFSAFQAQFVPQCVNLFRLRFNPGSGFGQIIAQRDRRFPLICLRPFRVLTQRIYEVYISHNQPFNSPPHWFRNSLPKMVLCRSRLWEMLGAADAVAYFSISSLAQHQMNTR